MVNIPKFWTWAHIRLEHYDYLTKWENNERIRKLVRNILFTDWGDDMSKQPLCLFWNRILSCEVHLKLVDLSQVRLSDLDSRIIAKSFVKIEQLDLHYPWENDFYLCDIQLTPIFTEIIETNDLKLKKLCLTCNDVSGVSPEILASAVVKLEEFEYRNGGMSMAISEDQLHAIIFKIANIKEEDLKLRKLDIVFPQGYLDSVQLDVLKTVFLKIDWILGYYSLPKNVMRDIIKTIRYDEEHSYKLQKNIGRIQVEDLHLL